MKILKKQGMVNLPIYCDGENNQYVETIDRHGYPILTPIIRFGTGYHLTEHSILHKDEVHIIVNNNGTHPKITPNTPPPKTDNYTSVCDILDKDG